MRSAKQIQRTPREHLDAQALERRRHLSALLAMLGDARERGDEWYAWIAAGRPSLTTEQYAALRKGGPRR